MRRGVLAGLGLLLLVGCAGAPRAKYPIERARGRYTVVAHTFKDQLTPDGTVNRYAVEMANEWAEHYRQQGQEAWVADLGAEAAVAVGTYPTRQAARAAADKMAELLEKTLTTHVKVRGGGQPQRRRNRLMRGLRPYPEELDHLKELVRRRRR